jgi:hypothetical protein
MTSIKHILLLLAVCGTAISITQAQEDSIINYYPLQIGNIWQYESSAMPPNNLYPYHYYTVTVKGDTTLQNGKTYRSIYCSDNREIHPRYQRIDSTTSQVFAFDTSNGGSEYEIDSLLAQPHSAFAGCRVRSIGATIMTSIDSVSYFSLKLPCRNYATLAGLDGLRDIRYTLTQGIGITSIVDEVYDDPMDASVGLSDRLVYAKINGKEYGTFLSVRGNKTEPNIFILHQNYPNPFNPSTIIEYSLSRRDHVLLKVFDDLGRQVDVLVDEWQEAGVHQCRFVGNSLPSGVYFYRLEAGSLSETRKLMLLR